jgi:hypothetical protein
MRSPVVESKASRFTFPLLALFPQMTDAWAVTENRDATATAIIVDLIFMESP